MSLLKVTTAALPLSLALVVFSVTIQAAINSMSVNRLLFFTRESLLLLPDVLALHSQRRATSGSSFVARRAGIQQAISATTASDKIGRASCMERSDNQEDAGAVETKETE